MKLIARDLADRFPDLVVTSSVPRNVELNSRDAQKGLALLGWQSTWKLQWRKQWPLATI